MVMRFNRKTFSRWIEKASIDAESVFPGWDERHRVRLDEAFVEGFGDGATVHVARDRKAGREQNGRNYVGDHSRSGIAQVDGVGAGDNKESVGTSRLLLIDPA